MEADRSAAQGRGLTIDCGEGKHDVCCGFGTSSYLIPQTAGERFECACPCHELPAASVADEHFFLEVRTRDGRLLSQWAIPVGEDASEVDVNAEIAWLRSPYRVIDQLPCDTNADALLRGDT